MMKVPVESIVFSYAIKYDILKEFINHNFQGSTSEEVDLFIDLYSIFNDLYKTEVEFKSYNCLTSCLFNLAGHYKYFFKKYYNVYTNIYFIFSKNNNQNNSIFIPNYNKKFTDITNTKTYHTQILNDTITMISEMVDYFPDIYYIEPNIESSVIIMEMINRSKLKIEDKGYIVLSKDPYTFQLSNLNAIILRPKINNQSYYINFRNALFNYVFINRKKTDYKEYYDARYLSLLYSLNTFPERGIKALLNINDSLNIIKLIEGIGVDPLNNDSEFIYNCINSNINIIDKTTFINRFKALDLRFQYILYKSYYDKYLDTYLERRLINKYDPNGVKQLNNIYFKEYPIDLNKL